MIFADLIVSLARFCGTSISGIDALTPDAFGNSLSTLEVIFEEITRLAVKAPEIKIKADAPMAIRALKLRFIEKRVQRRFCEASMEGTSVKPMAETRRFELLKGLTPYLVSSEAHSTGLCDVSELQA